jgi:fructose-1,6-bisphosphatase I
MTLMKSDLTLGRHLQAGQFSDELRDVVSSIADACIVISDLVALGAIEDSFGGTGHTNTQLEAQQKLDVISDEILTIALLNCAVVAAIASEEGEEIRSSGRVGGLLVAFDPLDGSSNIDVNASIGTIFSILPAPSDRHATEESFLQPGRRQLAAGYVIYGPQTMLILAHADGVIGFTLDSEGTWQATHTDLLIPRQTLEFSVNMSNQRHWAAPIKIYIDECLLGSAGPRGKNFNMRWVGSMVADVHRILIRGGIFLYPWDQREPGRPGKLRLIYEANPMAFIVERAGGLASNTVQSILDLQPSKLHERVAVVLGSADEVGYLLQVRCGAGGESQPG